jgi:glutamate/tyrosine decarboxylase-like PLP-dependent enzyme
MSHRSAHLHAALEQFRRRNAGDRLSLDRTGGGSPAAWFLGPKGENREILEGMVLKAIREHVRAREEYAPKDPCFMPPEAFDEPRFRHTVQLIEERLGEMLHYLHGSIPLSSYRNQSHMYWDVTLPGVVGYIAALLYNQNNVAAEASPVTTLLEMAVGDDLCRMLGFRVPDKAAAAAGALRPWGHITCDGSVANAESMWAARNLKFLPVALAAAIREAPEMAPAAGVTVRTLGGQRRRLADLDAWALLNLPVDEAIGLAPRITQAAGIPPEAVKAALDGRSVQDLGLLEFHRRFLPNQPAPAVMAPVTAHYSWPKGAALLGLGREAVRRIHVDLDGRMDTVELRRALDRCLDEKRPVLQVVAVVGSTEESAVDPLAQIADIRDEYRERGLEFALHADCAWGGYFASMLRSPRIFAAFREAGLAGSDEEARDVSRWLGVDRPDPVPEAGLGRAFDLSESEMAPGIRLSDYVTAQLRALARCETVTVDPHKSGFIPYPAGALCYRNGAQRDVVAFTAPVVYHGGVDPTVGVYGIEGSKPGAAAAAVYLSHSVIPADQAGYGKLLGRCVFSSKRFYAALVTMCGPSDPVTLTAFQRLPAEKAGATPVEIAEQIDLIRRQIVPVANDALVRKCAQDPELLDLFLQMGADLCIVAYAFNFRTGDGPNGDAGLMNELNDRIYRRLSIGEFNGGRPPAAPMFVTASDFDPAVYGERFVAHFAARAGVAAPPGVPVKFLISTQQNPWLTSTAAGNFTDEVIKALKAAAIEAAAAVIHSHGLKPSASAAG